MIKVCNLLTEDEVLEEGRAALTSRQNFLVLNGAADVRCEEALGVVDLELRQVLTAKALGLSGNVPDVGVGTLRLDEAQQADGGQKCGANHCGPDDLRECWVDKILKHGSRKVR